LRKEHPLAGDLAQLEHWTQWAEARQDREREEFFRRYRAATGQICGFVRSETVVDGKRESVAFLPTAGYSPYQRPVAEVNREGKFWRRQAVDLRGSFPLPKVKYFAFENVLPGRYIACAFVYGGGWFTKIVDVNVTNHQKLIFLELKHMKASGDFRKASSKP